jgi:GT2 family glycosyltransferase/glycosyltransferase involved in cell wall biosynthesis
MLQHERDTFERERNVVVEHARRTESERDRLHERFLETNRQLRDETSKTRKLETHEQLLREEFRHHLQGTRKLLKFLDDFAAASERLRHSRRWKLSNPLAWIRAFFSHKSQAGFGHLDKVESKFAQWKADHPETKNLEDRIQALAPRLTDNSSVDRGNDPAFDITPPIPLESLRFAVHEQPRVSIIIPVFNQLEFTHACLSSLQRQEDGTATEVIVVDDRSTDATPELIPRIPGLAYFRNDSNSGFIASCNHGAQRAHGEYLLFLNNDTVVTAGWLQALLNTFATNPEAGLIGSKLVYPDGRLQEAGGIIWRDGTGWNRGKFQDAKDPEYNYLREVDYCSGASLIIPRSLFDELGGFDSRYSPAYYEDTDLAFRVRARGHKVLYQPLSVVVHYEGITSGRDVSTGVKQHQEVNRATFVSTWANELADKANNGDLDTWDALPAGRERILVVDHHLPMADRDSGSLRMFQLLSILSREGHRVTFIPDNLADIPPYGDRLRERGVKVMHYPYCKSVSTYLESHGQDFDTVILSRCDFARKHISDVRRFAPQSRLIFDTVDLHFLRQEREAELLQSEELKTKAAEKRDLESSLIEQADQTWVVSSVERELLRAQHPHKSIEIVSNIVEAPGSPTPFALRQDLLFIGSFQHPPNTDAVIYFVKEIFPHILAQIPEVKFYVIGDKAPPEVIALAGERVILTGLQANVQPYFDSIKLSVAPLRFGAGVKGKINQSMGFGVPVVATSLAIEGMSLRPGEDVMIADEPAAFAAAVTEVYQSEEIWSRLSRNGLANTKQFFSIEAARRQLSRLLGEPQRNRPDPEPTMASGAEKRLSRATTQ